MPSLYQDTTGSGPGLDCRGADSGNSACWSDTVNIAVSVAAVVAFVLVLVVQFIAWPWTKSWVLWFFDDVSRPTPYTGSEESDSTDMTPSVQERSNSEIKIFVDKSVKGELNIAGSFTSIPEKASFSPSMPPMRDGGVEVQSPSSYTTF